MDNTRATATASPADRRLLANAITLIALGLSILLLNSWNTLLMRTSVGLFWGSYFLILNAPDVVRVFRKLTQKNQLDDAV